LSVPTYYGTAYADQDVLSDLPDYDHPNVPVVIHQGEAVRIVLGSRDVMDLEKPDVLIERRPKGWAIFLHPEAGGDPSGVVYFLDDGRSFVLREDKSDNPGCVQVLLGLHAPPDIDELDLPQPVIRDVKATGFVDRAAARSDSLSDKDRCARCRQLVPRCEDWYGDLCPTCADETDVDWICPACGERGSFEAMGGDGATDPECCGVPCRRAEDEELHDEEDTSA
jgi:hypothetical protein